MIKVCVLTSSRADYGIYLPLLKALKSDIFFDLHIIAFGTHLSDAFGKTANQILEDGFNISTSIDTMPDGDQPVHIALGIGKAILKFATIWEQSAYDLIIALGDRYEMFAACAASVPFSIPIAHLHGGETTLGAIDDVFRHSITQIATYHFTSSEKYKDRVIELKGSINNVYNVGALSIDNLCSIRLFTVEEFKERFSIDLSIPTILVTFHPETVNFSLNKQHVTELIGALHEIKNYQIIITMPNADTMGNMIREKLNAFIAETPNAVGIESFGTVGYLTCMKYCSMLLGNTSSGFIEASFFPKYVVNIGERQTGRIVTNNICNVAIEKNAILDAVNLYLHKQLPQAITLYGDGNTAEKITSIIKSFYL